MAQNPKVISGKILNEKNEPVTGASIKLENGARGVSSDVEGRYSLHVTDTGTYAVTFSGVGYATKTISDIHVGSNGVYDLNIVLEVSAKQLEGVVVRASARKESVNSLLSFQKNSATVTDGISAESIKRSPDRNTGEVLKRVSGASIENNKFVVVRGLIDRYNQATINNSLLPSTEPDKRAFSFDLIPSNLIDNLIIYKTANADLPGDFAGGLIQITTKDVPNQNSFSYNIGLGYNSQSTFKNFLRDGGNSPLDYSGFESGNRALADGVPSSRRKYASGSIDQQIGYSQKFKKTLSAGEKFKALPNANLQLVWNARKDLKNNAVLGSIVSLNYRNSQNLIDVRRSEYENQGQRLYDLNDTTYRFTTTIGALANFSYKKGTTKYTFKNIFNKILDNSFSVRKGNNYDDMALVSNSYAETFDKWMMNSQFGAEYALKRSAKLDWNVNYTYTKTDRPDFRLLEYNKDMDDEGKPEVPYLFNPRNNMRLWSYMKEHAAGGAANYSIPFTLFDEKQTFKAGYLGQYKMRDFETRWFRLEEAFQSTFDPSKYSLTPEHLLDNENLSRAGFTYNEYDSNSDQYEANTFLNAGYVMVDGKLSEKLRAVAGVRVESFIANIDTYDRSGELYEVNKKFLDVLPSINLTYNVTDRTNLRLSASRTVTRPEIRELTYLAYYDYIQNATLVGNPNLKRSQNSNIDIRFETYPNAGESFTATVFYKNFKNPIESYLLLGSNLDNRNIGWVNSPNADSYGIEVEFRKKLSFINQSSPVLDRFTVFANGALIKSESDRVTVDASGIASATGEKKPMQGQSNYIVNGGIQYNSESGWLMSALYNRIGHRLAVIGNQFQQDLFENGRSILDVQVAKKLGKRSELKLNVNDILNQKSIFYYNYNDTYKYQKKDDDVFSSFRYGTVFTLSLSVGI